MPIMDPADRHSYRLTGPELVAVWGLSGELLALVEEGLTAAIRAGRAPTPEAARASFERRIGAKAKAPVLDLLGFARARPLRAADAALLADRMLLELSDFDLGESATVEGLYGLSVLLEGTRRAMGNRYRRSLVKGTVDPQRCYALMGMATTMRPKEVTLRRILHSAWRAEDSVEKARTLAARWPLAIAGGSDEVS